MLWQRNLVKQQTPDRGWGVFTPEAISQGEIIYTGDGELAPGEKLLSREDIEALPPQAKDIFLRHGDQVGRNLFIGPVDPEILFTEVHLTPYFINHACDPNIWFQDDYTMVARRDIDPGEELTFDYCTTDLSAAPFRCHCGSFCCRQWVTGEDWRKMKPIYGNHFRSYINKLAL